MDFLQGQLSAREGDVVSAQLYNAEAALASVDLSQGLKGAVDCYTQAVAHLTHAIAMEKGSAPSPRGAPRPPVRAGGGGAGGAGGGGGGGGSGGAHGAAAVVGALRGGRGGGGGGGTAMPSDNPPNLDAGSWRLD